MEKKTYAVSMIGIDEAERHVLRNIFKLSQYRANSYTIAVLGEAANILMIDADDPRAMAEWRLQKESTVFGGERDGAYQPSIPTIMVTKEPPPDSILYYIRRPFVATRVISVLDQVAQKELQKSRERIIGLDGSQKAVAEATVKAPPAIVEEKNVLTALVVDDSSPIRKQLEQELKLFGIQVDAAATGEQAIEFINSNKNYDLIFLDVVLPGIDGYQICKTLKKGKMKRKTPVIMLTSKSSPFDRVKGALAGCDSYLTKPVKQETFQKVVKKYLR